MATILYRNAVLVVNGADFNGALHELGVEYSAEMLDETTFGDDTRIMKGGLYNGSISGKGFFDGAVGLDAVLFRGIGDASLITVNPAFQNGSVVEDTIIVIFPDAVTEGSLTTGRGYAMKGALETFNMGGSVGALLDITFGAQSRGIEA